MGFEKVEKKSLNGVAKLTARSGHLPFRISLVASEGLCQDSAEPSDQTYEYLQKTL